MQHQKTVRKTENISSVLKEWRWRSTPDSRHKACMRGHSVKVKPKSNQRQTLTGQVIHPWVGSARSCSSVVRHFARIKNSNADIHDGMRDAASSAQQAAAPVASAAGPRIDRAWPNRAANVRCWRHPDCNASCSAALLMQQGMCVAYATARRLPCCRRKPAVAHAVAQQQAPDMQAVGRRLVNGGQKHTRASLKVSQYSIGTITHGDVTHTHTQSTHTEL